LNQKGVGGLDQGTTEFFTGLERICKHYNAVLILDEVQWFWKKRKVFCASVSYIKPDIICMAKEMGNGFPIGGILIAPHFKASFGLLEQLLGGSRWLVLQMCSSRCDKQNLMANASKSRSLFSRSHKK
jgi:acetylornithine aminotransferase